VGKRNKANVLAFYDKIFKQSKPAEAIVAGQHDASGYEVADP
jgi:hypothetical protein